MRLPLLLVAAIAGSALLLFAALGVQGQDDGPAMPADRATPQADEPVEPAPAEALATNYLLAPTLVNDGETPIETTVGHSHAICVDWDGDGVQDLLVGQFGGGLLRYYRNVGTAAAPAYDGFTLVQAGGVDASIPSG